MKKMLLFALLISGCAGNSEQPIETTTNIAGIYAGIMYLSEAKCELVSPEIINIKYQITQFGQGIVINESHPDPMSGLLIGDSFLAARTEQSSDQTYNASHYVLADNLNGYSGTFEDRFVSMSDANECRLHYKGTLSVQE